MSSVLLYLAIVVMWLGVLVPMWLRRDRHVVYEESAVVPEAYAGDDSGAPADGSADADTAITDDPARTTGASPEAVSEAEPEASSEALPQPRSMTRREAEWRRGARIRARRRRCMLLSILLVIVSVVMAVFGAVPWWSATPSMVFLVAYVAVLRVAARVEAEQRERAARAQAERLRREHERRELEQQRAREAEIILFEAHKRVQVFDQYADTRRVVGG
ncbi:hypothetical protein J5X84_35890 [Streptosporangiaceae bacterium NEAU-GS5]|nr:hypothetical protein [Streptosporangiaceae bacterium NEAU-GS5]